MRKLKYLYLFAGMLLLATSCTTYTKVMNTAPVAVRMNLTMADMDYVGDVTGTATQSYFLGIPYGGRRYYYTGLKADGQLEGLTLPIGLPTIFGNRGYNNALYDALMQKPDADFLIPVSYDVKVNQEFLGSLRTFTVRAKAFKIHAK